MKLNLNKLFLAMANSCMTVSDLAIKSNVSRGSITKFTTGKSDPRPATLGKMAKALNVRAEDLIDQ